MDLDQLKQILELVREHELAEFEVEHDGLRLKVRKDAAGTLVPSLTAPVSQAPVFAPPVAAAVTPAWYQSFASCVPAASAAAIGVVASDARPAATSAQARVS